MSDRLGLDVPDSGADKPRLEPAPRIRAASPRDAEAMDFMGAESEPPRIDTVRLTEYIRVIYKRRWTAATAFILVLVGTSLYSFSKVPVYQARVRLLVEPERRSVAGFRSLIEEETAQLIDFQTQHAIINSREFARKAMQSLNIWEPAQWAKANAPREEAHGIRAAVGNAMSGTKGFFRSLTGRSAPAPAVPAPAGASASSIQEDSISAQDGRIVSFLAGVRVTPIPRSRLIEVTYTSTNPEAAATRANAIARQYIDQNLEFKFVASKDATEWLSERLGEQKKRVEAAEEAVQRYREKNQVIAATGDERTTVVIQRLGEYTSAMTRARTERIEKEALYNQMRAVQNDPTALAAFPIMLANPTVSDLRNQLAAAIRHKTQLADKFLDKHPQLIKAQDNVEALQARLNTEMANVVNGTRTDFLAARAAEGSLVQAYESQKRDALDMNKTALEFAVLQRDAESNRSIYESLLQRAREASIVGEPKTNNIRVLDAAEIPRAPSGRGIVKDLQYGAAGGLALALVLVWFFEYIDNRIKSPTEIQRYLGIPFLGLVPTLAEKHLITQPLVTGDVPFDFAEAFRGIRTNVLFSSAHEGTRSVVITSANPADGKTLVATNLAASLALAGQRVLLIDADLRRPRVHTVFDIVSEPGLSNLMVGNAPASEVIRRTSIPGLCVMPAGRIPPNPAELVGSKRFVDFVARLDSHFEWVIIDSPPAMAVTDPAVLGHSASATLLVVSAEKTSRHAAKEALDRLEAAGSRVLGAILNQVDMHKNPYYYARQYKQYYAAYEPTAAKAR